MRRSGVILLIISGMIVKLTGLLFKIPLTALLGESGMGYFNSAYTLFTWFYMISTAGLPTAEALMISDAHAKKNSRQIRRILHISLAAFAIIGIIGCGTMIFGADFFTRLMRIEKSRLAMLAIAPTLVFICQSAALRGYFQGMGEAIPHALSQLAEAFGKLFLGVGLAKYAISLGHDTHSAAAYAAFGLMIGVGAGTFVLYLSLPFVRSAKSDLKADLRFVIVHKLITAAIPITLSAGLSSLSGLLDSVIMTRRLHDIGLSQLEAAAIWGNYSSLALPMFNLPPALIYPLAYALMPEITENISANRIDLAKKSCRRTIQLTVAIAIPASLGLAALSKPILSLFFTNDLAARGAGMLTLLAPSSFLLCILAITNTVLQAQRRERSAMWAMFFGILTKIISAWFLIPKIGKYGTPISTFLCYLTAVGISIVQIAHTPLGEEFIFNSYSIWIAGGISGVTAAVFVRQIAGTIPAIATAIVIYTMVCGKRIMKIWNNKMEEK